MSLLFMEPIQRLHFPTLAASLFLIHRRLSVPPLYSRRGGQEVRFFLRPHMAASHTNSDNAPAPPAATVHCSLTSWGVSLPQQHPLSMSQYRAETLHPRECLG